MKKQIYCAQGNLDGRRLWEKYGEIRSEIRTMTSFLPKNLASMPSGRQLHDTYQKFIIERYRKIHVSAFHWLIVGLSVVEPHHLFIHAFNNSLTIQAAKTMMMLQTSCRQTGGCLATKLP